MVWQKLQNLFKKTPTEPAERKPQEIVNACCDQPNVHIAYRGKSDDRMYIAYNRTWQEVRYFQPNGLRVFCAVCRHRVY